MPTLPRLSGDGRQIKTHAKSAEVKESSFGVTQKSAKLMKSGGVHLVFDIENNALHFATEKECATGTEPGSKKFLSSYMGASYKKVDDITLKQGFLYLKPYYVKTSNGATNFFKTKKIEIKQGVKDKGDFDSTINKCRMIWVLCCPQDNLETLENAYPDNFAKLPDDKKIDLKNYVLVNKSKLEKIENIPYYQQSIDYAKSKGIKSAKEES